MMPVTSGSSESCVAATTLKLAPVEEMYDASRFMPSASAMGFIRVSTYAWVDGASVTPSDRSSLPSLSSTVIEPRALRAVGPEK